MMSIKNTNAKYFKWYNITLLLCVVLGVGFRVVSYFLERTLWLDEAAMAKAVLTRDFAGLSQGMLDYGQSAPFGFLVICKLFNEFMPSPELGLRAFPMICGLLSIYMAYRTSKDILHSRLPLFTVAMVSVVNILVVQANMYKAYSTDVLFSLLSIWLYFRYREQKLGIWPLCVCYAIFAWISFGNLFVMGSICIYHFVKNAVLDKEHTFIQKITAYVAPLMLVGSSVLAYYLFWIKPSIGNITEDANEYWHWLAFPLIPKSIDDLVLVCRMLIDFIGPMYKVIAIPFFFVTIVSVFVNRRNWFVHILLIATGLILVTSSIGLYPIASRLQIFMYVLYLILGCFAIEWMIVSCAKNKITKVLLLFALVLPTFNALVLIVKRPFYMNKEEFKPCYEYVQHHAKADDYVYFPAIMRPVADLYTGYKIPMEFKGKIVENGHNIWGSNYRIMKNKGPYRYDYLVDPKMLQVNIKTIIKHPSVYIIEAHPMGGMQVLYDELERYGVINEVYNFHDTRVLHFLARE